MTAEALWRRRFMKRAIGALFFFFEGIACFPAAAAPRELDCALTDIETKSAGASFDSQVGAQKRAIAIAFDEQTAELVIREGDKVTALQNVTITQTSMNGATDSVSLGIDRSSWRIVFQTYSPDSIRNEFGLCSLRSSR
jgi:hypothetical protein